MFGPDFNKGLGGQMDGGGDEDLRARERLREGRVRVEEIGVVRDKLDGDEDGSGAAGGRKAKGSGARNTRSKRREKVGL